MRDTSLRIIHSLEHYDMDIGRMVLSGGEDISRYLSAFGVDLFLSCNEMMYPMRFMQALRPDDLCQRY